MKISLKSIHKLYSTYDTGFDPNVLPVDSIIERIGLQLGAVEGIEDYREWYQNTVVVKVVSSKKHPNADKLTICLIDDGGHIPGLDRKKHDSYENGLVQVVCGAPNVVENMWAVWLPPQSVVPASRRRRHHRDTELFTLETREIRGEVSNGMLASPKELDISDEHEGILELHQADLTKELEPGMLLSEYIDLDDVVIDLENKMFTHRPDCFGELGVARELSGIFSTPFSSPDWYRTVLSTDIEDSQNNENLPIETKNEAGDKVPRFMLQSVKNVQVSNSSLEMQLHLRRIGIKPVNDVVDWTNYLMHMSGQPLHAYDYDKVMKLSSSDKAVIITRFAKEGEKIQLLNGKEILLHEEDIVIATDEKVIGLAGVMGGSETEVDEHTKHVIFECGTFDMYTIRRTSMRHGLFTEAVTRFNKGQSPLQNDKVLAKITSLTCTHNKGIVASPAYDLTTFDTTVDNLNRLSVTDTFIHQRLGVAITPDDIARLLKNVEFDVVVDSQAIQITVPFWRMDISIPEDIVEEVGRLYGYQHIPLELPRRSSKPAQHNALRMFRQSLREKLSSLGANEVLTYSFVHGKLLEKVGLDPEKWAYHLRNALSPDLQYYRPSVLPSLLVKIPLNIRAQEGNDNNVFALYEFGKAHVKGHNDPQEPSIPAQYQRLAFVFAADKKTAKRTNNEAYYAAKQYLDEVIEGRATYLPLDSNEYPITAPYQIGRAAVVEVDGKVLGVVGEFREEVKRKLKLPEYCAGFELDVSLLYEQKSSTLYTPLSQYPSVHQDITFEVSADVTWAKLENLIHAEMQVAHAEDDISYYVTPGDIYQPENSTKRRITFHIELMSYEKTLQMNEVNATLEHIEKAAHETLSAIRI